MKVIYSLEYKLWIIFSFCRSSFLYCLDKTQLILFLWLIIKIPSEDLKTTVR